MDGIGPGRLRDRCRNGDRRGLVALTARCVAGHTCWCQLRRKRRLFIRAFAKRGKGFPSEITAEARLTLSGAPSGNGAEFARIQN